MIAAVDQTWGIGKDGKMPWPHLPVDLARFKKLTDNSVVVMGRETWQSLPVAPLPNRTNVVLTKSTDRYVKAIPLSGEPKDIIKSIKQFSTKDIWIIGGEAVYNSFIYLADEVHITRLKGSYKCDRHFPKSDLELFFLCRTAEATVNENGVITQYEIWKRQ